MASLGLAHPDTATTWHNLAGTLLQLGQIDPAEALCEEAFAVRRAVLGDEHQATADSLMLEAGIAACREAHPADHCEVATALVNLAVVTAATGQDEQTRALNTEAIALGERLWPAGHQFVAAALNNLARSWSGPETLIKPDLCTCERPTCWIGLPDQNICRQSA